MNVFFIPSWYPSKTDPLPGIFFKEQAMALTKHFSQLNIGISTWGQNDERLLLWLRQPAKNITKLLLHKKPSGNTTTVNQPNLIEYFTPAYTWTSKILNGNFPNIIRANSTNLKQFESNFGKVDLIHAHVGFSAGYIAWRLSQAHEIPYIITEQMSPFPHKMFVNKKNQLDPRLRIAYENSRKNIAISDNLEKKMKQFGIDHLMKIPNLVDEDFFTPTEMKKTRGAFTFFSLGRIVPQKGIDILLKAFSKVSSNAELRIGGEGAYLAEYRSLAKKLNIDDKVSWLGRLDKHGVLEEFQNCDAFVLPSRHESMGVVFAEAMAFGKPSIGTECGGPEEFIDEYCGYIVKPEDVSQLTDAMQSMIKNHQLFNSEKIRTQFEERFSSKVVCNEIMDLYRRITG